MRTGDVADNPGADALSTLRARGRRLTRQRRVIWDTLLESRHRHVSAADIADAVRARDPRLHQATIYRTLDALVADGLLLRSDLGADHRYYELPGEHRHHHIVCHSCGAVTHIHDVEIAATLERVQAASGYTLDDAELTFSGLCPNCPTG
jgi:Fur family ferric uptake transcriptional regulator